MNFMSLYPRSKIPLSVFSLKSVAIDFDDVLFPFTFKFQNWCKKHHGLQGHPREKIKSPNFRDVFQCEYDISKKIFDDLTETIPNTLWEEFHLLDDSQTDEMDEIFEYLKQIKESGIDLFIVTARTEQYSFNITIKYCNKYFPGIFTDFFFCNTFASTSAIKRTKADICKKYNISVLVDDSLENIAKVKEDNIIGIPFGNNPWTQSSETVKTWEDLIVCLKYIFIL